MPFTHQRHDGEVRGTESRVTRERDARWTVEEYEIVVPGDLTENVTKRRVETSQLPLLGLAES